ncbi:bleomycin hydrolase, partial [Escherichia coli]
KLPFKITLTGRIEESLTIGKVTDELKWALETKFGRDSNFFDPNGVGKYILIKKKDVWAFIETLGYFRDFYLEFVEWNESNGFYDFVYLDTENSTFNISYEEE